MRIGKKTEATKPIVLAGKYELKRVLGEGGSGLVYLAWDRNLERFAAIKVAKAEDEQLKQEMEMLKRLKHPMLPQLYDYFKEDNWYLVLEYIEGVGLHKVIEKEERITEQQTCIWAEQLLSFFAYLHGQKPAVIYRDLKPENIIVCPDGSLRLVDFGAALQLDYIGKPQDSIAGSAGYAAPEQRKGVVDIRSDIYTIGALLYHMLTGFHPAKPPYGIRPVCFLNSEISRRTEYVVAKCTQTEPDKRYQTVEEIQNDLQKRPFQSRRKVSVLKRIEKQIWLTEKKSVGLWGIGIILVCFLSMGISAFAKGQDILLPVVVYNKEGQKVLIQCNRVYEPKGNLVLELEQDLFAKDGVQELSVCLTDCTTGEKKERIFYLRGEVENDFSIPDI